MTAPRFLVLADRDFGPLTSKTANSIIRYLPDRTVAVLDSQLVGKTAQDVLGYGGAIPVVGTMRDGLALKPDAVLIGIAPVGGRLPEQWRDLARRGARRRLRHLERAAQLPGRRPDAGGKGPRQRGQAARPAEAAGRHPGLQRPGQGRGRAGGAHGRHRLQRRQDDRAAPAGEAAQGARPADHLRGDRADGHHDRGLGHLGGRGGVRLHRRRGGTAGPAGEQGRGHRAGGGAGEHQSPRLLRGHPEPAARLLSRRADPLPPGEPGPRRRLPRRAPGSRSRR